MRRSFNHSNHANQEVASITLADLRYKASAYCSMAEHCRREVAEKLKSWGASEEQFDPVLDYLEDENYICELRYAKAFVHDKLTLQGWGKQKALMALRQKGISDESIRLAMQEVDEEAYRRQLQSAADKKSQSLDLSDPRDKARLLRHLATRGYSYDEICSIMDL